ncbi:hypothetical protein DCCM_0278 [Desulfocucumis palustris]|uniref:Uncharacterized protein n=1 Tax=Desulfocucumis palustris TaxID=1898651 RepID=A0A2L2X7C2_9FIRM|nr:hypothetical protein DCCM_0278 [Desulfocucumis palustris]
MPGISNKTRLSSARDTGLLKRKPLNKPWGNNGPGTAEAAEKV